MGSPQPTMSPQTIDAPKPVEPPQPMESPEPINSRQTIKDAAAHRVAAHGAAPTDGIAAAHDVAAAHGVSEAYGDQSAGDLAAQTYLSETGSFHTDRSGPKTAPCAKESLMGRKGMWADEDLELREKEMFVSARAGGASSSAEPQFPIMRARTANIRKRKAD